MGGKKSREPQHAKPQDDIKILVDPVLRLPVVESVKMIDIDGNVGVGQMGSGGRGKKVTNQYQSSDHESPSS